MRFAFLQLRLWLVAAWVVCAHAQPVWAQPAILSGPALTFTRDVAPILRTHCVACHHPKGPAPFSLTTFDHARDHAEKIADAVRRRVMPPWKPEDGFGEFRGARRLTSDEIATILRWVGEGRHEGGTTAVAQPTAADQDWYLGQPDLVARLPDSYVLNPNGVDEFRNFAIRLSVTRRRYVRAWQFKTTNPRVVHHSTMMLDRTHNSRRLDEADPLPGYKGLMPLSAETPDGHFLGWTPGQLVNESPKDMAWAIDPGADLLVMLHLRPTTLPESVHASIGFYFTDEMPTRTPHMVRLSRQDLDIPAGERRYIAADSYTLPVAVRAYTVQPHAHHLAREIKGFAILPDGRVRWLIYIKNWDFHAQEKYEFASPVSLPSGTRLVMEYRYDNSGDNPAHRAAPPQRVTYGQRSSDEMAELWIQVLPDRDREGDILNRSLREKSLPQNIAGYRMMLESDFDSESLHNDLALLYMEVGDFEKAAAEFRQVLRLNPRSAPANYNLGNVLVPLGRLSEAKEAFQRALGLDPSYRPARDALKRIGRLH